MTSGQYMCGMMESHGRAAKAPLQPNFSLATTPGQGSFRELAGFPKSNGIQAKNTKEGTHPHPHHPGLVCPPLILAGLDPRRPKRCGTHGGPR